MRKTIISILALLCTAVQGYSQKQFNYTDLTGGLWSAKSVNGGRSMVDGEHYTIKEGTRIEEYSYKTGEKVSTIFDSGLLCPQMNFNSYEFSRDESKLLLTNNIKSIYRHSFTADYWIYDLVKGSLTKLTNTVAQVATLSPDGQKAAFVRDNNLFWVNLSDMKETQITFDGKFNHILNGIPDWVYEEEYSFSRAYEWSPESDKIAYYKTNEERVKEYNMTTFKNELYPENYKFKYPKAGEQNSIVSIYVFDLNSKENEKLDVGNEDNQYIPHIEWSNIAGNLAVSRLNRVQNLFELLLIDTNKDKSNIIYSESNSRYVERINGETITFLDDPDKFIVKSEKTGFSHLYLYSISKGELAPITSGDWDVTGLLAVDNKTSKIYFMSAEDSPLERNLYTIKLNGKEKTKLTKERGNYTIAPSVGFKYYISFFSSASTPNQVTLHTSDSKLVRVLESNEDLKTKIQEYKLPLKEFFTFTTSEGVTLNGYMIKPNGFDTSKEYPLFMTQYSGPGSQSVMNRFSVGWEDVLVQNGYIVACVDGRGTGARGEEFKKCTYKDLGKYETIDQIEAAKYLGSLPYINKERIAIYGWSYGGFMALNCILKGCDVFKVAISVAPVTSWRYYDTIYTELYNGLPQENPGGYDKNSPIFFSENLKGKLLIAHGTGDDNVHIQTTYEMINSLVNAGKEFEMCIYPDQNHGMGSGRNHLMNKCIDFISKNL